MKIKNYPFTRLFFPSYEENVGFIVKLPSHAVAGVNVNCWKCIDEIILKSELKNNFALILGSSEYIEYKDRSVSEIIDEVNIEVLNQPIHGIITPDYIYYNEEIIISEKNMLLENNLKSSLEAAETAVKTLKLNLTKEDIFVLYEEYSKFIKNIYNRALKVAIKYDKQSTKEL